MLNNTSYILRIILCSFCLLILTEKVCAEDKPDRKSTEEVVEPSNAIILLKKELQTDANNVRTRFALAMIYFELEQYNDAALEFKRCLQINPDFVKAHYSLGVICQKQKNYPEAIKYYKKTISLNPKKRAAYNNLGVVYDMMGRHDDAITQFKQCITVYPEYAEAHNNLGSLYGKKGLYEEAIKEFEVALRLKPSYIDAQYNLNYTYNILGKARPTEDKLVPYKEMVIIDTKGESWDVLDQGFIKGSKKDSLDYFIESAATCIKIAKYDEAIEHCIRAVETGQKLDLVYYLLGKAYSYKGGYKEALENYQKAIEINPDFLQAHLELGMIYADTNNPYRDSKKGLYHYKRYEELR